MKRIITILLFIVLVLSLCSFLVGCGTTSNVQSTTNSSEIIETLETTSTTEGQKGIDWPNTTIASVIPKPEFMDGKVEIDSDTKLLVKYSGITKEDYVNYLDLVKTRGFTIDSHNDTLSNGDEFYRAKNQDGYSIDLTFEDGNSLEIIANAPDDLNKAQEKSNLTSVSPDFKELMDSYERFVDQYVVFMKKYKSSNDISSMLNEYTNYMSEYSEFVKKINAVDKDSLSEADAAYYVEVTTRTAKKLAEVA